MKNLLNVGKKIEEATENEPSGDENQNPIGE